MNSKSTVIVIGGGVIGCSIAFHLSKCGVNTTVVERGRIGAEASAAASGLLGPSSGKHPYDELATKSYNMFPQLTEELEDISGIQTEFLKCGMLEIAITHTEVLDLSKRFNELSIAGIQIDWLEPREALGLESQLNQSTVGAIYMPNISKINNRQLCKALAISSLKLGAEFRHGVEVTGLVKDGQKIIGVEVPGDKILGDKIVIAAGAWTGTLAASLGLEHFQSPYGPLAKFAPIHPVKGQNINLQPPGCGLKMALGYQEGIFVPQANDSIVAGPTLEQVGFDTRVTAGGLRYILNIATTAIPSLEYSNINWTVAGLRPNTPDELPILGPLPDYDNIIIASGHHRSGINLSPVTGRLITDLITGNPSRLIKHFDPTRFINI